MMVSHTSSGKSFAPDPKGAERIYNEVFGTTSRGGPNQNEGRELIIIVPRVPGIIYNRLAWYI